MTGKVDFFIVGTQKGGTTTLARNLARHSDAHVPSKEPTYFYDLARGHTRRDDEGYLERVRSNSEGHRILGDKSPSYMQDEQAIKLIAEYNPSAKIILCIRHPIARMYSRYQDIMLDDPQRLSNKTFAGIARQAVSREQHWVTYGYYVDAIKALRRNFPNEQILILVQERMRANTQEVFGQVCSFLGLDQVPEGFVKDRHVGNYNFDCDADTLTVLGEHFRKKNEGLTKVLGDELSEWRELDDQLGVYSFS